jgi:hypothetical protein
MPNLDGKWTLKLVEIVLQESEQHAIGSNCYQRGAGEDAHLRVVTHKFGLMTCFRLLSESPLTRHEILSHIM